MNKQLLTLAVGLFLYYAPCRATRFIEKEGILPLVKIPTSFFPSAAQRNRIKKRLKKQGVNLKKLPTHFLVNELRRREDSYTEKCLNEKSVCPIKN